MTLSLAAAVLLAGGWLLAELPRMRTWVKDALRVDTMRPVAIGTRTVELVYQGHNQHFPPVFSLTAALNAGFADIHIGNDRFVHAGGEWPVYFRTAALAQRPRYTVTETVLRTTPSVFFPYPQRGDLRLVVADRGAEIALWHGPGPGWAGDQAAAVVATALKPGKVRRLGEPDYPKGSGGAVDATAILSLRYADPDLVVRNCPQGYALAPAEGHRTVELRTPGWNFGGFRHPDSVVCSDDGVVVFLNEDYRWEMHATMYALPAEDRTEVVRIADVEVRDGMLHARRLYYRLDSTGKREQQPYHAVDVAAPMSLAK